MLILKSVEARPLHGWGVSQRLRQLSSDALKVGQGSLYPALYRLEERGWLKSAKDVAENGRQVRFYQLTRSGRRQLEQERQRWESFARVVAQVLEAT